MRNATRQTWKEKGKLPDRALVKESEQVSFLERNYLKQKKNQERGTLERTKG